MLCSWAGQRRKRPPFDLGSDPFVGKEPVEQELSVGTEGDDDVKQFVREASTGVAPGREEAAGEEQAWDVGGMGGMDSGVVAGARLGTRPPMSAPAASASTTPTAVSTTGTRATTPPNTARAAEIDALMEKIAATATAADDGLRELRARVGFPTLACPRTARGVVFCPPALFGDDTGALLGPGMSLNCQGG